MTNAEQAYLFRHSLLRDAAYQLQLPGDRANLHALAFELIEQALLPGGKPALEFAAEELSDHARFAQSGEGQSSRRKFFQERESHYLKIAALSAAEGQSLAKALTLFERLQAVAQDDEQLYGAISRRARCLVLLGRSKESLALLDPALTRLDKAALRARFHLLVPRNLALDALGRSEEALAVATEMENILEQSGDEYDLAVVLNNKGNILMNLGRLKEAGDCYKKAQTLAQRNNNNSLALDALANLSNVCWQQGDSEGTRAILDMLGEKTRHGGTAADVARYQLLNADFIANTKGEAKLAEAGYLEAERIYRVLGNAVDIARCMCNRGSLLGDMGKHEEAIALLQGAAAIHQEAGNPRGEGITLFNLAETLVGVGRLEESLGLYDQALVCHRKASNNTAVAFTHAAKAITLLLLGRTSQALAAWNEALSRGVLKTYVRDSVLSSMREACAKLGIEPLSLSPPLAAPA
jgi:tetratricopeptide (TPR) repeat protein